MHKREHIYPRLSEKRIVVTGAASGIGKRVAIAIGVAGGRVCLMDINDRECTEVESRITEDGGEAFFLKTDISDEGSVDASFAEAKRRLGGMDALVHLAGILDGASIPLEDFSADVWDRVIAVNLRGSFLASRAAARSMADSGGVIVLTSSGAGVLGGSSSFAYGASKGGVHGLAMVLSERLDSKKIRVIDVLPGSVATPLKISQVTQSHRLENASDPLSDRIEALADPDEVAKVFVWAISDEASALRGYLRTV